MNEQLAKFNSSILIADSFRYSCNYYISPFLQKNLISIND